MDWTAPSLIGPRTGKPFSLGILDLAALGYREEEYLVGGKATAYRGPDPMPADGVCPIVPSASAAYTTRLLVRRPVDPGRFNGIVIVEWFNVSGGVDADVDWLYTHTELIRDGFGWVGVSAQHAGITGHPRPDGRAPVGGLQAQDPDRYGALVHPGDDFSYDIFSQAGRAVREAMPGTLLIASGMSQSAYRLTTYINAVDPIAHVYDGFFVHSRAGACAPLVLPGETGGADPLATQAVRFRPDVRVPVLTLQTETDVGVLGYANARQVDTGRFRLWEVAGSAHGDTYLEAGRTDTGRLPPRELAAGLAARSSLIGITFARPVNSGPQHHYVANAAIQQLTRWVRDGTPPPAAPRLAVAPGSRAFEVDACGNTLGGVRSPYVDVPIASLSGLGQSGQLERLFGTTRPFDAATLRALYGSRDAYLAAFNAATDAAVRAGFLLGADAPEIEAVAAESSPL